LISPFYFGFLFAELPDHRRIINTKKASQIANKKSPGILRKKMTKESPINYSHDSGVDSMNTNSSGKKHYYLHYYILAIFDNFYTIFFQEV
jgi:hypothetical protein